MTYSSRKRTTARGATHQAGSKLRTTGRIEPVHPVEDEITIHVEEIQEPRDANAVVIKTQKPVEIQEDLSSVSEATARDVVSRHIAQEEPQVEHEQETTINVSHAGVFRRMAVESALVKREEGIEEPERMRLSECGLAGDGDEASDVTCRGDEEQPELENACMLNCDVEMSPATDEVSHLLSRLLSAPVSESFKSHLLSELTDLRAQQEVDEKLSRVIGTSLELRQRSRGQEEEYERAKLELSARFKAEEEKRIFAFKTEEEKRIRELMEEASKRKSEEDKRMRQLEEQEGERRREEMEQERRIREQENELIRAKEKLKALARVNTAASNSPGGTISSMSPPRGDISASASLNNSLPAGSAHAGLSLLSLSPARSLIRFSHSRTACACVPW